MAISRDLASQFAKITNDKSKQKEETVYGTVVSQNDKLYVVLDGSNSITPIVTTAEIKSGERVAVMIKGHTATVIGNISNPGTSQETTGKILDDYDVIVAKIGDFELIVADKVTTEQLEAELAIIEEAIIGKATIEDLEAVRATIEDLDVTKLEADIAEIEKAIITKAEITDLDAIHAEIDLLESNVAEIETLIGGNLTMDNIQSLILTSSKVTVDNAFIKDAMIDRVSASKLTAGSINTNLIQIASEDGSMSINGSLQQFKDEDGNVRIQIGKDATGDFTFALYGEDGQGQLINQNGITASAISDGLIVNDMVADNAAISGGKLDIDSVIYEINENDSTINSSRIYLDETNQSLDVAFSSLKTTVENIKDVAEGDFSGVYSRIEALETDVSISQGEIETLISNSVIETENGQTVLLKDDYSTTKQTVDQMSSKIGSLETTTTEISSRQSKLEQDLDGFELSVSNTYSTKDQVASAINGIELGSTNFFRYSNFDREDILDYWGISNTAFHTKYVGVYGDMGLSLDVDKHIKGQKVYRSRIDLTKATTNYVSFYPWVNGARYYMTLEANTTYTFSYWVYLGGNTSSTHATIYYQNDTGGNTKLTQTKAVTQYTGGFEKCSVTFTTNSYNNIHVTFYHYQREGITSGNSDIYIYQPMLTKGNKETSWSENPADIEFYGQGYTDSQVTQAKSEFKITTDSITSSVSSLSSTLTAKALTNYNNLLVNSNIKNGTQGWRLNNLELNKSLYASTTTATAPPDRHTIILGSIADNTAQTRYMDSTKFIVQAGEKISLSYYIMSNQYVSYGRVYILFTDNTKPIEEDNTFMQGYTWTGVEGYSTWVRKTETVTVPEGATRAFIRIRYQSLEKTSTDELNRIALASIMVSRGEDYPTWTSNTEDAYYIHEDRLKYAESKITDDAIINTVSSTYYKKTEVDNTINNIEVGGTNLIRYTDFNTDKYLDKWTVWNNATNTLVGVEYLGVYSYRVYSNTQESDNAIGICTPGYIKLIGGQEYTLSFAAKSGGHTGVLDYIYILNEDEGGTNQNIGSVTIHANSADLDVVTNAITFVPNVDITNAKILIGCYDATVTSSTKGFYIKNIKLEKGNKATAWSPSPLDTDDKFIDYEQTMNDNIDNAIQKGNADLLTSVDELYTKKDMFESFQSSVSSQFEQTSSDIQMTFSETITATNIVNDNLETYKAQVSTYIRFDENGIEMGESDSPFKSTLSNEKLAFIQDGNEVAYISNNRMYVTETEVLNSMILGNWVWVIGSNGNLTLKWRDE